VFSQSVRYAWPLRLPSTANDLMPEEIGQRHTSITRDVMKPGGSKSSPWAPPGRVGRISISGSAADSENVGRWNIMAESSDVAE